MLLLCNVSESQSDVLLITKVHEFAITISVCPAF